MLNLFLALLLNAFDNGDDDDDKEENENDSDKEEPKFKQVLAKLTQTKKSEVFPVTNSPLRKDICSSSQEIQTVLKESEGKNSGRFASMTVGAYALRDFSLRLRAFGKRDF